MPITGIAHHFNIQEKSYLFHIDIFQYPGLYVFKILYILELYCHVLQELDIEFSAENRRRCADASAPLIHAVEQLTTFAASPEFASVPAKISTEVRISDNRLPGFLPLCDVFILFF